MLIPIDIGGEPFRTRVGADHEKEPSRGHGLFSATPLLRKHEVIQPRIAATSYDLGAQPDADVRCLLDLTDQIVGHAGGQ